MFQTEGSPKKKKNSIKTILIIYYDIMVLHFILINFKIIFTYNI